MNIELLNKMVEEKLVVRQKHPSLDLYIYNYTQIVQYNRLWNETTLQTRGLIMDGQGNVIAKGFNKFFNLEEHSYNEIPNEPFEVFDKMDGSLGIFFHYNGEWHMATRGSFTSEQAIKGMEIARKYNLDKVCVPGFTYLFEIIYPENRIVVRYGDVERLVLLSIFEGGTEIPYNDIEFDGWDIVNRYDGVKDFTKLKEMIKEDQEGYVVRFKSGFRIKIKGDEYVRLHRILTNISNRDIWEYLKDEKPMDELLEKVPDEFYEWVKETAKDLQMRYDNIEKDYLTIYNDIEKKYPNRKDFAEIAKSFPKPQLLFAMLDKKDYKPSIWKFLYPAYSKPFKKNLEE